MNSEKENSESSKPINLKLTGAKIGIALLGLFIFVGIDLFVDRSASSQRKPVSTPRDSVNTASVKAGVHDGSNEDIKLTPAEQKKLGEALKSVLIQQRKTFADNYERGALAKGMDLTVTLSGKDKTTIRFTYVLMNRPLVYQLTSDTSEGNFMNNLRDQGFKKCIFDDGYGSAWTYSL